MRKTMAALVVTALAVTGCGGGHKSSSTQHQYRTTYGVSAHAPGFGLPPKNIKPKLLPPTATRTGGMYDTVTIYTVPSNPFAVAGYVSGHWPTYGPLVQRFPRARHISIAVNVYHRAQCLDIEPGDATPSQAAGWFYYDQQGGYAKPCFYANLSTMGAVKNNLSVHGIARNRYFLWVAYWVYHSVFLAGYDGVQWTDHSRGLNLDESTVSYSFLGIQSGPTYPICYHHRIPKAQCAKARKQVASWTKAHDSSVRASKARHCPTLGQRDRYFAGKIAHDHSTFGRRRLAYRRRALAATRRAEKRQECSLFASRAGLYGSLIYKTKAAN